MVWLLFFFGVSFAQAPPGRLVIETSPGARVEVFPGPDPLTYEISVHANDKPLGPQLKTQRSRDYLDTWATSVGSGTGFISLHLREAGREVIVRKVDEVRWVFETRPRTRPRDTPEPPPTITDLLQRTPRARPARPPELQLTPLLGDAWQGRLDPRVVRLPFDGWRPEVLGRPPGPASLATIDALRQLLATTEAPDVRAAIFQNLALDHQELGLHREARGYFDSASRQRVGAPMALLHLHRADAYVATGRWEEAHKQCTEAHDAGAPPLAVLTCVAGIALATGKPSPTPTARALVAEGATGGARLLAAQLLVIDHRYDEALPLIQRLEVPAELTRWRDITLADIALAQDNRARARALWRDVGTQGELGELATRRLHLLDLLDQPAPTWAQAIPVLEMAAESRSMGGAEALHLLAQITKVYDDAEMTASALTRLLDNHDNLADGAQVRERLIEVCTLRMEQLRRIGVLVEHAGFFLTCWREDLDPLLIDPTPLQSAADTFAALGLWDTAEAIQRRAVSVLVRDGREDLGALTRLAELYRKIGQPNESIETVVYARKLKPDAKQRAHLDLIEGRARLDKKELIPALSALLRAESDPETRRPARTERALALAERRRCGEAVPLITELIASDLPDDRPALDLAMAQCELAEKAFEAARARAHGAAERTSDPHWLEQGAWIAAMATLSIQGSPAPTGSIAPRAPLTDAIREVRRSEDALRRAEAIRRVER